MTRPKSYFRNYYAKNKDKARAQDLKKNFGMTVEEYDLLLKNQNSVCGICKKEPSPDRKLCVDHNHESGSVRGLLCDNCNRGLGLFKDDVALMEEAVGYLKNFVG